MNEDATLRIIMDIVLTISVIFGWWFVYIPLGLICLWFFPYYAEFIALGFLHDALFGMGRGLGIMAYAGTLATAAVAVIFSVGKLVVRWK